VLVSLPGLLILVPLAWLLGHALAQPLVRLESVLANVGNTSPELLAGQLPSNQARDEIGRLTEQAGTLLLGMAEKERLESAVVASERLAAVGRVSGAIAHEINNPLGGMLTAIDTARTHGDPTPMIDRTLQLLDRGLRQIQGTVSALLVEARLDSPNLLREDWQDLLTLVKPQTDRISLIWRVSETLPATIQRPAHAVRQICLNLLLYSIKAASSAPHAHDDIVDATTRYAMDVQTSQRLVALTCDLKQANAMVAWRLPSRILARQLSRKS
jgi:signal transduction histidine kinase